MPYVKVKCRHCGAEKFEDEMGIYCVELDQYFCDHGCMDAKYAAVIIPWEVD